MYTMGASRLVDLMYLGKTVLVAASVFSCSSGAGHLLCHICWIEITYAEKRRSKNACVSGCECMNGMDV